MVTCVRPLSLVLSSVTHDPAGIRFLMVSQSYAPGSFVPAKENISHLPTNGRYFFLSSFLYRSIVRPQCIRTSFFINWIMKSPQSLFMETVTLFTSRLGGSNIKAQQSQPNIYTCNQPTVISFTFASSTPCKHSSPLPRQP